MIVKFSMRVYQSTNISFFFVKKLWFIYWVVSVSHFVGNRRSGRIGSTFRRVGSGPRKVTLGQLWFTYYSTWAYSWFWNSRWNAHSVVAADSTGVPIASTQVWIHLAQFWIFVEVDLEAGWIAAAGGNAVWLCMNRNDVEWRGIGDAHGRTGGSILQMIPKHCEIVLSWWLIANGDDQQHPSTIDKTFHTFWFRISDVC